MARDDAADLVIETLAMSEAELRERVAELEADVRSYIELSHEAIHALHVLTLQHDRKAATIIRLTKALREARAQIADLTQQIGDLRRELERSDADDGTRSSSDKRSA